MQQLYNSKLSPELVQEFRYGLWCLFKDTGKHPPRPDRKLAVRYFLLAADLTLFGVTGQVIMKHTHAIYQGKISNVFLGMSRPRTCGILTYLAKVNG
jgi:hypothetical protein